MFTRILVPIDGSVEGYELVDRAIDLAVSFDAALYVAFIKDVSPGFTPGGIAHAPTATIPADVDDEDDALDFVARSADKRGVSCRTSVRRGEQHMAILNAAGDAKADLIVLRSPRRTLWRRLPVTATDRVVRKASASVLTLDLS